jgi:REP element-mobilizing transposase RayT
MVAVPPKATVSQAIGHFQGESAIHLAGASGERKQSFVGQLFRTRGFWVSTVG